MHARTYLSTLITNEKLGQSDLVTGFICHIAHIAVLPAERLSQWAACYSDAVQGCKEPRFLEKSF